MKICNPQGVVVVAAAVMAAKIFAEALNGYLFDSAIIEVRAS